MLAAAEAAGFDVLVTPDRNLRYQQNFANRKIALVVLSTNAWPVIREHGVLVADVIKRTKPGSLEEVKFPRRPLGRRPATGPV